MAWRISRVFCQKGPICHAEAWRVGPFWQDAIVICIAKIGLHCFRLWLVACPATNHYLQQWIKIQRFSLPWSRSLSLLACCVLTRTHQRTYFNMHDSIMLKYLYFNHSLISYLWQSSHGFHGVRRKPVNLYYKQWWLFIIHSPILHSKTMSLFTLFMLNQIRETQRYIVPDIKLHGAYMGPACGRQDPMLAQWTLLSGVTCG